MANIYKPFWSAQLNKELLNKRSTIELQKIGRKFNIELDRLINTSLFGRLN